MDDEPIFAEFHDNDITVLSTNPLRGTIELAADTDETVLVELDRESAEALLSALVQFLAQGEGDDAPKFSTLQ